MVQECSWYVTMILSRPNLMFPSNPGIGLIAPLMLKEKRRTNIHAISIFYLITFFASLAQNLNNAKLGLTLLLKSPQ
jgi:hypothetical protein